MSLLEQDTTNKEQVDENVTKFEAENEEEYEVEGIQNSAVYAKETEAGHLSSLYYLVSWKGYTEEKDTWEPVLAVQHLRKLIGTFHKDKPSKPTATSPPVNTVPLMA